MRIDQVFGFQSTRLFEGGRFIEEERRRYFYLKQGNSFSNYKKKLITVINGSPNYNVKNSRNTKTKGSHISKR